MKKTIIKFDFDGKELNYNRLWIDKKWLASRLLWNKVESYVTIRHDAGNMPFKEDRHGYLINLACFAQKLIPNGSKIRDRYTFGMLKTKFTNPYRYYRFYMGFPSHGQRTWSNAKSAKKRFNHAKFWEEDLTLEQFLFSCPKRVIGRLSHLEFLNNIWDVQWHHEWVCARNYRLAYERRYKYKSWRFGFDYALNNRALTYYVNPYKMKRMKGKRKVVLPKNQINVGLEKGFAEVFYRKIFSKNVWKYKKHRLLIDTKTDNKE